MAINNANAIGSPVLGGISTLTNNGVLLGSGSGVVTASAGLVLDLDILVGVHEGDPVVRKLTGGTNVTLVASGTGAAEDPYLLTVNASGGGSQFTWNPTTTSNTTMASGNGYSVNASSADITMTFPTTVARGDTFAVCNNSITTGHHVIIAPSAGQTIIFGGLVGVAGATGTITSSKRGDVLEFVCIDTNTIAVIGTVGASFDIVTA